MTPLLVWIKLESYSFFCLIDIGPIPFALAFSAAVVLFERVCFVGLSNED